MSEPFWKELVDRLKDEERETHLDPIRREIEWRNPRATVERELLEEIAGALGRSERRVQDAITKVHALMDHEDDEVFERARREAMRLKRDLSIHREALRFPRDPEFDRRYPIPPARRR